MTTYACLVFLTYLGNSILAHPRPELDFTKCVTDNQDLFVKGIENLVESSDPIAVDLINVNLPKLTYKLRDAKLTGLKNCAVAKLRINTANLTFEYKLECQKIEATAEYFLKGRLADISLEGDGEVTVTTGIYILIFKGYFEKVLDENKIQHARIKNYYLDFEAKQNLNFNFTNLHSDDKDKSNALNKFMNENWKLLDKNLRASVLTGFMDVFINHLNDFLKVFPIEKLFPTSCAIQD